MMRKLIGIAGIVLAGSLMVAGCTSSASTPTDATSSANAAETANAGAGLDLIFTNQPAPIFAYSAYRQQLIEIEATEALGTPTTAFFFPPGWAGNGSHPFKVCNAQGLPIPNSTQLDNPDEIVQDPYGGGYQLNNGGIVKPQADPYGVYTPDTGEGTYVTCIGKGGGLDASYWEGDVYAESAPAEWNQADGMIQDIGPSALPTCTLDKTTRGEFKGVSAGVAFEHCTSPQAAKTSAWMEPKASHGHYVLTAYVTRGPAIMSCSFKTVTYRSTKTGTLKNDGVESACTLPDGTPLTFAPWGIVSSN